MTYRYHRIGLATAIGVVVASLLLPTLAWAHFRTPAAATVDTFATHMLQAPPTSSCGGLGVLSVTITWGLPADNAYVTGYDLGQSATSGGPYTFSGTGTGTTRSMTFGISSGEHFYVIRSVNHSWFGVTTSPERHVTGILTLAATCS